MSRLKEPSMGPGFILTLCLCIVFYATPVGALIGYGGIAYILVRG